MGESYTNWKIFWFLQIKGIVFEHSLSKLLLRKFGVQTMIRVGLSMFVWWILSIVLVAGAKCWVNRGWFPRIEQSIGTGHCCTFESERQLVLFLISPEKKKESWIMWTMYKLFIKCWIFYRGVISHGYIIVLSGPLTCSFETLLESNPTMDCPMRHRSDKVWRTCPNQWHW